MFCGAATILGDGTVLVVGGLDPYAHVVRVQGHAGGAALQSADNEVDRGATDAPGPLVSHGTELADGSAVVVGGRDANGKPNHDIEHSVRSPRRHRKSWGRRRSTTSKTSTRTSSCCRTETVFTFAGNATSYLDPTTWRIVKGPVPLAPEFSYPNAVALPITPGHDIQMVVYGRKNKFAGTTTAVSSRIRLVVVEAGIHRAHADAAAAHKHELGHAPGRHDPRRRWKPRRPVRRPVSPVVALQPGDRTWTPMASQTMRRAYHSTTILLPTAACCRRVTTVRRRTTVGAIPRSCIRRPTSSRARGP